MEMAEIWNKYEPTAARKRGRPGRETRPKSLTVDMHAHVAVPRVADIVTPHLKQSTDPLVQHSTPETQALMAKQAADIRERIATTDQRFRVMDDMGVDMQLVCPAPPQIYYNLPLEVGVAAARAMNDGIADYVGKHKDRLVALGGVPLRDGNEAAKELERGMKKLDFKGAEILTNVNGKELSDPAFAPFWKKAEELDALVLIHPTGFTQPQRFARFYFNNVIGNPLDTTVALHYLIFDGVFERHPKLRVLAVHGGGFLGAYSGRIDHAWGARSDSHGTLPKPPTAYLRRNVYFDSVVFTAHQLEALVKTYGADRIVMGTDYPFDMRPIPPRCAAATPETFSA
jgi:aminocarboxymuconate-semialdehyde decarboxylase